MGKKRRVKTMSPTSIVDLASKRREKAMQKYAQVKPITKLTPEQMKSSNEKKRRED
ncbi:hypothetical protein [Paenibacillus illinoisensis]|uniref:hypothetical protein n=1 Tax=Paenibacillus illinoisensis TaxID=59845 RepID=UPI003017C1A9